MPNNNEIVYVEIPVEKELPENNKIVFAFDERVGIKRNAFYVGEGKKVVCEFSTEYDEMPEWLTEDKETETYYYKVGWYEELENSGGYYDFIIYPRKVKYWLKPIPLIELMGEVAGKFLEWREVNFWLADVDKKTKEHIWENNDEERLTTKDLFKYYIENVYHGK